MLDPVTNPYSPGAGSPPPALVGRDAERENFDVATQRLLRGRPDRSQLLIGLRGVGKTVLLREFSRIAQSHGWRSQHLECVEETDFVQSAAQLARASILELSAGARMGEFGLKALGVLKAFQMTWEIPGGGTAAMGIDCDPTPGRADSGDLDRDLPDLLREVGQLAQAKKTGVLFAIDEMQYIPASRLRPLLLGLHEISQLQLPLLVTGAGLPSIYGPLGEARSYAERLFAFVSMDSLSAEAASEALARPAAAAGVQWEEPALSEVFDATGGYPYFLQEYGKQTWRLAEGPERITRDDVSAAKPHVAEELDDGFFSVRVGRTTKAEREYLKAMAALGSGPYRSGAVARELHKSTQQVSPIRDSLIKRGLCFAPEHDVIDFTVPMFDAFARRSL